MATSLALPERNDLTGASAGREGMLAGAASLAGRFIRAGAEPAPAESAAAFRIIFGVIGLIAVVRFAANGWISDLYIEPAHHFSYYGFGWVQPWPGWGMYLHFALLALASLGVALGYRYRLSIIAFFLLFTYVELIDRTTYLNHYYLVSALSFVMVFLPLHRVASLDARRKAECKYAPAIPRGVLWLLMAQIGLVYLFAGLAKLNPDWLFHAQPLRIWLYNAADVPLIGSSLREEWVAYAVSWGGVVFDLTIVGWLLWRKSRPLAYVILVTFHAATALLFPALGMFPWLMIGITLIFFAPNWPLGLVRHVGQGTGWRNAAVEYRQRPLVLCHWDWKTGVAVVAAAIFLLVQLALPLRHFAYPGNVRWTDEGYLFAWRMMLTEKAGQVIFRISETSETGERLVYPDEYLAQGQVERVSHQPDLILATAHLIRDDYVERGYEGVQVRADAYVSYNGRPAARLIDPEVDLATISPGIGYKDWVMPEPE